MDVALHLSRRERQRPRLDRRHRQAGPGRSAAVMQFLDQLLCPLAGHPWRQKLAEWSKGLRSHGLDSEMDHAKTSQGWTLKQDAFGWNVIASRLKVDAAIKSRRAPDDSWIASPRDQKAGGRNDGCDSDLPQPPLSGA